MSSIEELISKGDRTIAGIMSGTSLDGVDIAIVSVANPEVTVNTVAFQSVPYPERLRSKLLANSSNDTAQLEDVTRLNIAVARFYADALGQVLSEQNMTASHVDLIGSHGQTICHLPTPDEEGLPAATLQIGDPSALAVFTGIPVVGDFRIADMAAGGQGAPLVPYFDHLMFSSTSRTRVALNIGGIANVTILPAGGGIDDVIAFDTGPGNMVMDGLARRLFDKPYDEGGRIAASGSPHMDVVSDILRDPYFLMPPPKSTGREDYGDAFVERLLALMIGEAGEDVMATAAEITIQSIGLGCRTVLGHDVEISDLIAGGGGVRNEYLMSGLEATFKTTEVVTTADFGIDPDAKEAICFAVLANQTVSGKTSNVPSATGASKHVVSGKLCLPPAS